MKDLDWEILKEALADYISVLEKSSADTHRAENRNLYQGHLASAALMYAAIAKDKSVEKLRVLLSQEQRSYGWSYPDGPSGEAAEAAFYRFFEIVMKD